MLVLVAAMLGTWHSADAAERPFVVFSSARTEAYQDAASGVLEGLKGHRAVAYTLDGDPNRIPHVVDQLSLLSPKVVIAVGSLAVLALKSHPVDAGVVVCLAVDETQALELSPSWVVSMHAPYEEVHTRLQALLPKHRIGVLYHPQRTGRMIRRIVAFFERTPIRLVPIVVRSPVDLASALAEARADIDALWIMPDSGFLDALSLKYLLRYSVAERLPLIGYSDWFTRSGGLLSLMADYRAMGLQAAELAIRVEAGEHPARIQAPRNVKTFINLRVAQQLHIPVNPGVAALADGVYP